MKVVHLLLLGLLFSGLVICGASATLLDQVHATYAATYYDVSSGILTIDDIRPLQLDYPDIDPIVLENVHFYLTTTLDEDLSIPGMMRGRFMGGQITLTADSGGGAVLLTGNIGQINVINTGLVAASGSFSDMSGSLWADWGTPTGDIVDLIFCYIPADDSDFSSVSFDALSTPTLLPTGPRQEQVIPEPLTIGILGIGLAGMALLRKKRP